MAAPMIFLHRRLLPVVTRFIEVQKYNNASGLTNTCSLLSQKYTSYSSLTSYFNYSTSVEYRQLDSRNNDRGDGILINRTKSSLSFLKGFEKSFSWRKSNKPKKRRVPKLILLQNPFTWLMIKIDFSVLRNIWDPLFKEREFKYGTKQVV